MGKPRPNFNKDVKALLRDAVARLPEFSHIKPARILVVAGEARRASRGSVKPLKFDRSTLSPHDLRRKPIIRVRGKRMLYCITLRPLFFRASTPQARIGTLLHELFHISSKFDGTLARKRRHAEAGESFEKRLRPLVHRYLKQAPVEVVGPFSYDGEVRVLQWVERPSAFYIPGARVRRVYTEEQLFWGPVQMLTRRPRPGAVKARIKLH